MIKVAIVTVSDKGARGEREDKSGRVIEDLMEKFGGKKVLYEIIPDDFERIKEVLKEISDRGLADLVLTTGGTGFAGRDVTPEATLEVIEKEVPGIPEKMRRDTAKYSPFAVLSRARAGIRKGTLIINLPGNPRAVRECLETILEVIPHGVAVLKGEVTEHKVK